MKVWRVWEEEFGASLSGYGGRVMEYVIGLDNSREEIEAYLDKKCDNKFVWRSLLSISQIEVRQLKFDEIGVDFRVKDEKE